MNGWLRSWKLCEVCPEAHEGVAGWRKHRLKRAALVIPPGNLFMDAMNSGCQMLGSGWAEAEVSVFRRTHQDFTLPRILGRETIWLPHLPGLELRQTPLPDAILAAFHELGRFHRLAERSIHGDPHAGNFLHDATSGRCRIIDFETTLPNKMESSQGRARDFAILALDLWQRRAGTPDDFKSWRDAYGNDRDFCPVGRLFRSPGCFLRCYWRLLGYRPPLISEGFSA